MESGFLHTLCLVKVTISDDHSSKNNQKKDNGFLSFFLFSYLYIFGVFGVFWGFLGVLGGFRGF